MKLGGGRNKDFAFYWLQVKNKNHNNNKNNRKGDVKKWVQAEGNRTESVHENLTEKLESGVLVYLGKMDKGGNINL